jgi:hypothetical protein
VLTNPFRTLRGRLATTYVLLALVGVAASALYTASTLRSGLRDRVAMDLADEARLLSAAVSDPLAAGDANAVKDYIVYSESLTHGRFRWWIGTVSGCSPRPRARARRTRSWCA